MTFYFGSRNKGDIFQREGWGWDEKGEVVAPRISKLLHCPCSNIRNRQTMATETNG